MGRLERQLTIHLRIGGNASSVTTARHCLEPELMVLTEQMVLTGWAVWDALPMLFLISQGECYVVAQVQRVRADLQALVAVGAVLAPVTRSSVAP